MAKTIQIRAQLLKDNQGSFIAEDGRNVDYHNGTFFDLDDSRLFKANFPDGVPVPPIAEPLVMFFDVLLGEKFTKLEYVGSEA
ncbi:MAG: hypothetical protein HFJ75_03960 [Eggerthellaceae bacterium]|nr:hypothetical protein [Eggerthellaceae bacterium]